jgi:hypothetical protein
VERDVCGYGRIDVADLGERDRASRLVEGEAHDVEQVRALLVDRPVHHRLELHRDQCTRFGDGCRDVDVVTVREEDLNGESGCRVIRPGMR